MLEPDNLYSVATADFLALGGDNYHSFKNGINSRKMMLVRNAVAKYFETYSPVSIEVEKRGRNYKLTPCGRVTRDG